MKHTSKNHPLMLQFYVASHDLQHERPFFILSIQ